MDTFLQASDAATVVWEKSLHELGWYHYAIAAAYLAATWLCFLNGYIARQVREADTIWFAATAALCVLAANTLLRADVFVPHLLREMAQLEGWYGERREFQYLIVAFMAMLFPAALVWLRKGFTAAGVPSYTVAYGLLGLLVLFSFRLISAHVTDAFINVRVAGVSFGRWLEFAGIGLVVQGAWRCLQLR
jgi:hypothetical protein